ncbi:pyruvate kinase [Candidatus Nitrosoglobus terrae]|uniref:Pyruvate kinase n=1 Tax=Candidatus Nitrosoglobus terrae TaxID=1630141 RepID=A0A1Q2SKV5_9GAMM|nr:pyruvate kinase [Candidatus Nitrosoglobus terrae]BAW79758.1 pyruvate kinase [Candidatus Nitrosoglobus terrae]
MLRRTKIVATLGPATDDPKVLDQIIEAGVDVVRLNFSHGHHELHRERAETIRRRAQAYGRQIGVLADLQGPKIRIAKFKKGKANLEDKAYFTLDTSLAEDEGDETQVGVDYKALADDVVRGDTLLLDDGRIVLQVEEVVGSRIDCQVVIGGILLNNKGINRQGGGLSAKALTMKDREDIQYAAEIQADYLAVSFPRSAADLNEARELFRVAGGKGGIVAKIERAEALEMLEEMIAVSEAVMVARGDLGVEIGDAALPPVQKEIINLARKLNRVVITATQMMETMIKNPIPTRAEVFDVANAVFDGTDAVMLSAETASGDFPGKAVAAMDRICREAEKQYQVTVSTHRISTRFSRVDEGIAMSAMYLANHFNIKAIIALTESGTTPLWMSRISSAIPIYALTQHVETRRKVTLYRGVCPVSFNVNSSDHALINREAVSELQRRGAIHGGDWVIITQGDFTGVPGGTNALKVVRVGDMAEPSEL